MGLASLDKLAPIYEAARIKPSVVQVESHPYLPEPDLLELCCAKGIVLLAWAAQRGMALLTNFKNVERE